MNFSKHSNNSSYQQSEIEIKLNQIKNKIRYQAHQNYFKDIRAYHANISSSKNVRDQRQNIFDRNLRQNSKQNYNLGNGLNDGSREIEDNLCIQNGENQFSWKDCRFDERETFNNLNKLVGLYNTIHQGFFNYTDPEIIHILINRTIQEIQAKVETLRSIFQCQNNRIFQADSDDEGRIFMMILIFKELEQLLMSLSENGSDYRDRLLRITNGCQMLSSQIKSILGINTIKAISC